MLCLVVGTEFFGLQDLLAADLLPKLETGSLSRILFLSTGAMMSPDSIKQGQSIPAVAHLLEIASPTNLQAKK